MKVTAIILASGKGKRIGLPKADISLMGISFIEQIRKILTAAGMEDIFVASYENTPDMLATLRRAVSELKSKQENSGYLVFPVDFPFVFADTVQKLIKTHYQNPLAVLRPIFNQQRGHPILIPSELNLDKEDKNQGLQYIIHTCSLPVVDIPVKDSGILKNVNTKEDLELWMPKK